MDSGGVTWRLTDFYEFPASLNRHLSWDLMIRQLRDQSGLPWVTIGDFNEKEGWCSS